MSLGSKRLVYVLDDDPAFIKLMDFMMRKLGLLSKLFTSSDELLAEIRSRTPTLCLIDLNLETPGKGFELIQEIRNTHHFPIFIVSSETSSESIAHALEIGANDYLIKPLNREVFTAKLSYYLESPELEGHSHGSSQPNQNVIPVNLNFEGNLIKIDEMGVVVSSANMIPKGTVITISGEVIEKIFENQSYILATAISNSTATEGFFKTYLEFDHSQKNINTRARTWILDQTEKSNHKP